MIIDPKKTLFWCKKHNKYFYIYSIDEFDIFSIDPYETKQGMINSKKEIELLAKKLKKSLHNNECDVFKPY